MHIPYRGNAQDRDESVADVQQRIDAIGVLLGEHQTRLNELLVLTPVPQEALLSDAWLQAAQSAYDRFIQASDTARSSWQQLNAYLKPHPTLHRMAVAIPASALPAVHQALRHLAEARELEQSQRQTLELDRQRHDQALHEAEQRHSRLTRWAADLRELLDLSRRAHEASVRVQSLEQAAPTPTRSLGGLLGRLLSGYGATSANERDLRAQARRDEQMASDHLQDRARAVGYIGIMSPEALSAQVAQVQTEQDELTRQLTAQRALSRSVQEVDDRVTGAWAEATRTRVDTATAYFLPHEPSVWEALQDAAEVVLPLLESWHQAQHLAQHYRGDLTSQYPGWFAVPRPLERASDLVQLAHARAALARELAEARQHLDTLQAVRSTPEPVLPEPAVPSRRAHELLPWSEEDTASTYVTAAVLTRFPVAFRRVPFPGLLPWVLPPADPERSAKDHDERAQAYPTEVLRQASLWGRRYGWRDGNHLLLADVLHHLRWSQEEEDIEAALIVGLSPECLRPVQLLRATWTDESQNHEVWRQRPNHRLGSYWDSDDTEWYAEVLPRRLTWADATQLVLHHWRHLSQNHPDKLREDDLASIYDQLTDDLHELRARYQDLPFDEKIAVGSFHHYLMDPPRSAR